MRSDRAVPSPPLPHPLSLPLSSAAQIKGMEAAATKMAPNMPDGLKGIASQGASISADLEGFAKERPELYASIMAKFAEADAPGVRATTDEAKDPFSCKYTEEGTMVHDLMQNVAKSQRRMRALGDFEITLSASDKAALTAEMTKAAAEKGLKLPAGEAAPDSMKLF